MKILGKLAESIMYFLMILAISPFYLLWEWVNMLASALSAPWEKHE